MPVARHHAPHWRVPARRGVTLRGSPRGRSALHARAAFANHRSACRNLLLPLILDTLSTGLPFGLPIKLSPSQPARSYAPYSLFDVRAPGTVLDRTTRRPATHRNHSPTHHRQQHATT